MYMICKVAKPQIWEGDLSVLWFYRNEEAEWVICYLTVSALVEEDMERMWRHFPQRKKVTKSQQ